MEVTMNKRNFTRPLMITGLLALVGVVGAQTYYTHELARRVAADEAGMPPLVDNTSPAAGAWDPWVNLQAEMLHMRDQMDQMFTHSFQNAHGNSEIGALQSGGTVTLEEQGKDYVVKADIPGVKESDISVNLEGRLLSISAQSQGSEEQKADNGEVVREERFASRFQRAFTLPEPVNAAGMHTQFRDGVLTVTVPKATS
jgi:HSP20 family protein